MTITQGFIPEKITYVVPSFSNRFRVTWEDSDEAILDMPTAYTTWPCSAESTSAIKTATNWALQKHWDGSQQVQGAAPVIFTMENKDLTQVKILGLEYRGNGGRAYKVYIPAHNFPEEVKNKSLIFDLREDTLLYILLTGQIDKGVINHPLRFAVVGSALKLVPSPSPILTALESKTEERKLPLITKKDLVIGRAYTDKRGEYSYIYLGDYEYYEITKEGPQQSNYNTSTYRTTYSREVEVGKSKGQLWYHRYHLDKIPLHRYDLSEMLKHSYAFHFVKSKAVIKDIGETPVEGTSQTELLKAISKEYPFKTNSEGYPEIRHLPLCTLNWDWPSRIPLKFTLKQ